MRDSKHLLVYVTVPGDRAALLARAMIERGLAACVNIVDPVRSIYRWKGEVCDDREALMIIKTRRELFAALKQAVAEQHPYELPEVIGVPIDVGSEPYLRWIDESTGG